MTTSVMVMAEVIRAGRFLNVLFGAWIIAAPWLLEGAPATARWNDAIIGIVLIALALPRGAIHERYAGWDDYVS